MTGRLVDTRFTTDVTRDRHILRKGRGGGKQAEDEQDLLHRKVSRLRRERGIIRRTKRRISAPPAE